MPAANLEERLTAICKNELLTPATHDFLVSVLAVLTEARQALEPFAAIGAKLKSADPKLARASVHYLNLEPLTAQDLINLYTVHAKFSASPVLIVNQAPSASAPPKVFGVSRMCDNEKAVLVSFARRLTDDELRTLHEYLRHPTADLRA